MASRFYSLTVVALIGILGIVSPPDILLMNAQAQTTQDRKAEADRLFKQGNQQYEVSQFNAALQSWQQALTVYQEIKDRQSEGRSLGNLGLAYYSSDKYDKALDYFQQFLAIARDIKDRESEGKAIGYLGLAYQNLGKYDKAIEYQLQRLAIAREIADRQSVGEALNNLGVAYELLGKYDKALDYYQQYLAIAQDIKDRAGEGKALGNLGRAYEGIGKSEQIIAVENQLLAIDRAIRLREGNGKATDNLENSPEAFAKIDKYDKAIDSTLQWLAISREISDRSSEAYALNWLGNAYSKRGRDREAIAYLQQSLTIAKEIGDRRVEGLALAKIGQILSKIKQPELAIVFYKQAVTVRESIRKDIKKLDRELQKSYLNTVADDYRNLADLLLKQDRILEAQQVLDLLKVEELNQYFRNVRGNNQTAQGVDLQSPEQNIIALAMELSSLQQKDRENKITASDQQRLTQLVQTEKERNKQFNAFLDSPEIRKLIDELRRSEQNQNVNLNSYRKLQKDVLAQMPNAVMLYPLILEDRLELILINSKTPPIRRTVTISRTELNQLIVDFRAGLLDAGSDDVQVPAQQLYQAIIKPFESELQQLNIDTIIYAPDGQLRYIPLAGLFDGKQWLAEKYKINNITAESLTSFNTKPIAKPYILAGAFGGKSEDSLRAGFSGLPATITEVQKISKRFPNTTSLIEANFTKIATESRANSHTILHLATHGELSIGSPEDSFILFGNGDKATIREIKDWSLSNIDLVILSACQTGLGKKLGSGVEILGLGYQMQTAGARAAIASLWQVDDSGTQALMEAFYSELQKGDVSIAEALRRAQVSLIRSSKFNHPNYWSSFFAIGNGL